MEIIQTETAKKGQFSVIENGSETGKMTYTRFGNKTVVIDHTEVNPKYKGRGIGKKLVLEAVNFARKNKLNIVPVCPFAKNVFEKTPEIQDVL